MLVELGSLLEAFEVWTSAASLSGLRKRPAQGAIVYEQPDGKAARLPTAEALAVLSENAIDRNVFAENWMVEAGAVHLRRSEKLKVLVSQDETGLTGLLPVVFSRWPFPVRFASVWNHAHSFEATPLVREGRSDAFLDDLFTWLATNNVDLLKWPRLALDDRFAKDLFTYLQRTGRISRVIAYSERPTLAADSDCPETYVARHLTKKRRRDLDRCRRRLAEIGTLEFRTLDSLAESDWWASEFLRLESTGWKGEAGAGTALACREEERAHFLQTFSEAARRGQLLAHSLELNGRSVAMTVNYRAGGAVWAYKTAYDDSYAKYAPGVIVEVEGTRAMLDDPTIRWVDSCSEGDNAVIEELWPGRRRVGDLFIAVRPGSNAIMAGTVGAGALFRAVRDVAKTIYRRLRPRQGRA